MRQPSLLHDAPFLVPVLFFIAGIVGADVVEMKGLQWIHFSVLGLAIGVFILPRRRLRYSVIRPLLMNSLLLLGGYLMHQTSSVDWNEAHYQHLISGDQQTAKVQVLANQRYGTVVRMLTLDGNRVVGEALVPRYALRSDSLIPYYHTLNLEGVVRKIRGPRNPGQFDFSRYCALQGFKFEIVPDRERDISVGRIIVPTFRSQVSVLRHRLLRTLDDLVDDARLRGVAKAMLLGDRTSIDADQRDEFQEAGLTHILAISGLHVGTVYLFLIAMITFCFPGRRDLRIGMGALILIVLWFYYLMSGCSISAWRATLMFTMLEVSDMMGRGRYSKNALALAALCTLMIDSNALFDVGFQLSYLAVMGILLVHKPLLNIWSPSSKVFKVAWSLFLLTLSAQLLSFPLILYYFHKFSFLSFLTGVCIVPLTGILIQFGFLLLLFSAVPILGSILLMCFTFLLRIVVKATEVLPDILPWVIEDVWIHPLAIIFLSALTLSIPLLINFREWRFAFISSLFLAVFLLVQEISAHGMRQQSGFTVYHISGHSLASFVDDGQAVIVSFAHLDSNMIDIAHRHLSNQFIRMSARSVVVHGPEVDQEIIRTRMYSIAVQATGKTSLEDTDFLWIRENGWEADFSKLRHMPSIVIDGSVDPRRAYVLERRLKNMKHKVINLWRSGGLNHTWG